jgi:multidrug efflux pump subunit AcrA (membrane-fusion protein)
MCLCVAGCKSGDQSESKPVVNVSVQRAAAEDVPLLVSAPASVFGKLEARISPRITATVQQLLVHKGETVKKGQLLAVLDQRDLAAQRADAAAAVSSAQAALQRTQAGTIPAQLTQARGDLDAKRAALNLAQKVYERRKDLYAKGAISNRELQTSEADEAQAQANYNAARTNLDVLEKHTSADDLRMAENALAQSKAQESLASANLSFANLRSPFDGTVTEQFLYQGDLASAGSPILTVVDLSSAVAHAEVNADDVMPMKMGQSCSFALNDAGSERSFGKITVVNQAVDPARRTIEVWCEIPNQDHALKARLFGTVRIEVGTAHQAVVLPSSAVEFQEGTQTAKVYVVDSQNLAHVREVKAVPLDDKRVRILSGLSPGETVITVGEYGLPDGTEVSPTGAAR